MHFFSHTSKVLIISSTSLEKFSSVTLFNMYFSFINLVFFCLFFFHLLCIVMSLLYILVIASATEQVNRLWGVCVCVCVCVRAHMRVCMCMLSCVLRSAAPWTVAHQTPLCIEFPRQEYWTGLPFPTPVWGSSQHRDWTCVPCIPLSGGFSTTSPTSLLDLTLSHLCPTPLLITEHWVEHLALYSSFPLAVYFIHGSVYMSIQISQFISAPIPLFIPTYTFSMSVSLFLPFS